MLTTNELFSLLSANNNTKNRQPKEMISPLQHQQKKSDSKGNSTGSFSYGVGTTRNNPSKSLYGY